MSSDRQVYPFGIIPAEVFMDERLTLETLRVLGALYTFRDKHTSLAFPSRDELSSRCAAMHPSNISAATSKLVDLGWLVKEGKGGNSRSTRYTIRVPDIVSEMAAKHRAISKIRRDKRVAEQATVADWATVASQATGGVADKAIPACSPEGYTRRVAQPTTRIEQTNRTNQLGTDQGTELQAPENPGAAPEKTPAPTDEAWFAYADAYFNRYGTEPIRNALANAKIKQLIDRIGKTEAPHVAAFYVRSNNRYYVQRQHNVKDLVTDAEGLRTQWVTGRTMTIGKAADLEGTSNNADAAREAMEIWKRRNGHANV